MNGTGFTPGIELNRGFYADVVATVVGPWPHAAGLLGWGSDVLGFDTGRSTDHGWGPRLTLLVAAGDVHAVSDALDAGLPDAYRGLPVRYGWDDVASAHQVTVSTLPDWLVDQLGVDATAPLGTVDWLLVPQQRLLGVVGGALYHDPVGDLRAVRDRLAWYPRDVWLWLLACQWRRLAQEEAFVGRTAEVGDETGSALVVGRLARDAMRLAMLQERRYAPYSKWLGTAFGRLPDHDGLGEALHRAAGGADRSDRESSLTHALELLAARHNALGITEPVDTAARGYHERPYRVLGCDRFVAACMDQVGDPGLRALPLVGGVDQVADSTDLLSSPRDCALLRPLYGPR